MDWMEPWADEYVSAHGAELADSTSWHSPNVIGSLRLAEDHLDRLVTTLRERAGDETRLTRGFFPPLWDARSLRLNDFSRAEVTWRTSDAGSRSPPATSASSSSAKVPNSPATE
jgi:hypothetical protein